MTRIAPPFLALILAGVAAFAAEAQPSPADLLSALRAGGLVVVMRHASSPGQTPDAAAADPANTARERQLDEAGRTSAEAMGEALRRLDVPAGRVLASPTYRTRQTARLIGFPEPELAEELATPEGGMAPDAAVMEERGAWLRERAAERPPAGTNTLIVTHGGNLSTAFGGLANRAEEGDAFVFQPDGAGASALLGRIPIAAWPGLAQAD